MLYCMTGTLHINLLYIIICYCYIMNQYTQHEKKKICLTRDLVFFFLRDFSNKFWNQLNIRFNLNHNQSCNLNKDKLEIDIQSFEFRAVLFLFEKCIDIPCCCDWNLDTSLHVSSHYNSLQHIIFSCFYLHSVRHLVMNIFLCYTEWD